MQLICTLMVAVSILVFMAGLSVLIGLRKKNFGKGVRFFLATLGSVLWTVSILVLLNLPTSAQSLANFVTVAVIASITVCDVALLAYLGWEQKNGKLATLLFGVVGAGLVAILAMKPEVFFEGISLNNDCNKIIISRGWYFYSLIVYFFGISITFSSFLMKRIKETKDRGLKTGLKVFYVGLSIGGILALIFDLLLLTSLPNLVWIGPMASSISILSFFYSVVKYRVISLSSKALKVMSYSIFVATGLILYILMFYAVFTALFRIPNPSTPVLILNGVMALILIILIPAINEISQILRSSANFDKIQFSYIMKKIEKLDRTNLDYKDIAKFLADNMHYSFVGLIVCDRAYFSENIKITATDVQTIGKMKAGKGEIFIVPDRGELKAVQEYGISKIGVMHDKNGAMLGKIVFGKKLNHVELTRIDMVEYEAIINMTAAVIEDGGCKS